ncbi:hypothetical protein I3760_09G181700 [Carya illinoinensis]|nr:hypothetical protein I3760_09G181700 [Carya illinoinensis]
MNIYIYSTNRSLLIKMAVSSLSISNIPIVAWAIWIFLCRNCLDNALHQLVNVAAASGSISDLQLEQAKALHETGWWPSSSNISSACDWDGITCNDGGSVTSIDRFYQGLKDIALEPVVMVVFTKLNYQAEMWLP